MIAITQIFSTSPAGSCSTGPRLDDAAWRRSSHATLAPEHVGQDLTDHGAPGAAGPGRRWRGATICAMP
jgi:hypothetical protein